MIVAAITLAGLILWGILILIEKSRTIKLPPWYNMKILFEKRITGYDDYAMVPYLWVGDTRVARLGEIDGRFYITEWLNESYMTNTIKQDINREFREWARHHQQKGQREHEKKRTAYSSELRNQLYKRRTTK